MCLCVIDKVWSEEEQKQEVVAYKVFRRNKVTGNLLGQCRHTPVEQGVWLRAEEVHIPITDPLPAGATPVERYTSGFHAHETAEKAVPYPWMRNYNEKYEEFQTRKVILRGVHTSGREYLDDVTVPPDSGTILVAREMFVTEEIL